MVCESYFTSHKTHENKLITYLVVMQITVSWLVRKRMISYEKGQNFSENRVNELRSF